MKHKNGDESRTGSRSTHNVPTADEPRILAGKQCDPHSPSTRTPRAVGREQRAAAMAMARSREQERGSRSLLGRRRGDF